MAMRIATAAWADPDDVESRYTYRDGMVWLGRSAGENQAPLGYRDDRHVCVVGGSRGGKGTTSIIPALVTWPGSICVVDPKGENATITAARRGKGSEHCQGMGQTVQVLDPFKAAQVDDSVRGRFNPLDALDPENEEAIDEAGRIADAIVVIHQDSKDPFWDESARAMIKGLILHILTYPPYEGRRNLIMLRKLITRGDWELVEDLRARGDDEKDIPSAHGLLWTALMNNPAFDGLVAGFGDTFRSMVLNAPKEYESVLQTANRNTEFLDSPAMQRVVGDSDFQLSELKTRPEGLSLYLCLPQRYMNTHYRWLRMMIALTVTEMEKVRGRPAAGHPILMVLDEFAGLKRMEVIENAVAQIAGFGVKMFFVLQSLEQLKGVYKDNWETFLANSGLKVFFNVEDNFSRDYVSKLIGETEVVREVRSSNESVSASEGTSHSTSESQSESHSRSTSRSTSENRGRSSSLGASETEGTNSSVSSGTSAGVNSSHTKGKTWNIGESWTPTHYLLQALPGRDNRQQSDGKSWSKSETEGESRGWNEGRSEGASRGTSRSRTDGTSESFGSGQSETEGTTYGTSRSETVGTTRGTSQSRTSGAGETIHKRALVTPDEIGQLFARIDDRAHQAYPGLALVVISGARPVALRRVNYYEDLQFAGLFDPHPDHPFLKIEPPKPPELSKRREDNLQLLEYHEKLRLLTGDPGKVHFLAKVGQRVEKGEPVASLRHASFPKGAVAIKAPAAGTITYYAPEAQAEPRQSWFTVSYEGEIERFFYPYGDLDLAIGEVRQARVDAANTSFTFAGIGAGLLLILTVALIGGAFGTDAAGIAFVTGIAAAGLFGWGWSRKNQDARYKEANLEYIRKIDQKWHSEMG